MIVLQHPSEIKMKNQKYFLEKPLEEMIELNIKDIFGNKRT